MTSTTEVLKDLLPSKPHLSVEVSPSQSAAKGAPTRDNDCDEGEYYDNRSDA